MTPPLFRPWWLCVLVSLLAGCGGGAGPNRQPIHGMAKPVKGPPFSGMITFVPDTGVAGPSASATLKDGKYEFTKKNGPVAGPHRVTVLKVVPKGEMLKEKDKPRGKKPPPPMPGTEAPTDAKQMWEFTITVPAAGDENLQCDFDLE